MKHIVKLSLIAVFLCLLAACEKPIETDIGANADIDTDTVEYHLANSTWKLVGIFDAETNTLIKELEPTHCEECYTLTFNTDSLATAYGINTTFDLDLSNLGLPNFVYLDLMVVCERYHKNGTDYCDSDSFRRAITTAQSYMITADELRLFFHYNKNHYLLFKPL